KTDRIDVDLLLGALLGWLRGEPRRCTMVPIPSIAEEDRREPGRERETLVAARLKVENQIGSLLIRYGISGFKPRLKKAMQHLESLRAANGQALPPNTMERLRRLMAQHRQLTEQLR
ncbi:IS110 family transposase, partial [Arthrospira platensis SPKY1]|nr:IS110 family transposase [Arthrospira platensis SPKY1]